jgi:4-amino-4-deoxy-L-arabinose transferase-like glycosyltransferase
LGAQTLAGLENVLASGKPAMSKSVSGNPPVSNLSAPHESRPPNDSILYAVRGARVWLLFLLSAALLFTNLGAADFFEPDEGRNAEKAREVLVLNDWVTPRENFLPVLDKPMFFYWLVALSLKAFGTTEWSARLPCALAALGCLFLVYRFARRWWGPWEAMWSVLILLTTVEFFLLARIVILDMILTLSVTLALCSFYTAVRTEDKRTRALYCLLFYSALGIGTLTKGLVGVVIPGMVCLVYLLLTRRWFALRSFYLLPGALVFLAIVGPWYIWADARNPGYVRYYFWEEHFTRYLTDEFERNQSWFYFLMVLAIGFAPWMFLLPAALNESWKKRNDQNIFMMIWAIVPLVFLSASKSQLPHYVLPLYPALAILSGQLMAARFKRPESKNGWLFYLPWVFSAATIVYLWIGGLWPPLLARAIRASAVENFTIIGYYTAFLVLLGGGFAYTRLRGYWKSQNAVYLCACIWMAAFFLLVGQLMVRVSADRSSKSLAQKSLSFLTSDSQVVIFNTYISGLPFYLDVDRPIWVVAPERRDTWMGSPYLSEQMRNPPSGHGKVLRTFDEFAQEWKKTKYPLLVFAKAKHIALLERQVGEATQQLASANDYVVVSKSRRAGAVAEVSVLRDKGGQVFHEGMEKGIR